MTFEPGAHFNNQLNVEVEFKYDGGVAPSGPHVRGGLRDDGCWSSCAACTSQAGRSDPTGRNATAGVPEESLGLVIENRLGLDRCVVQLTAVEVFLGLGYKQVIVEIESCD